MQFIEFKNYFNPYQVFSIKDIEKEYPKFNKMNLIAWQKKKYIIKIRRRQLFYFLNKTIFSI